jgi:CCR4-NOT transcription complex subunit 1
MEVYTKYFRRLLQGSAGQIFPGASRSSENSGSYSLLVTEVQKIRHDPHQAFKIAESVDTPEGDLFRDFDLSTFLAHFKLDPVSKTMLALAFKSASKSDLRTKGEPVAELASSRSNAFQLMLFFPTTTKSSCKPSPAL